MIVRGELFEGRGRCLRHWRTQRRNAFGMEKKFTAMGARAQGELMGGDLSIGGSKE
jgi:hypothetical protein